MDDYLFREPLSSLDPELAELIGYETERQARKLVMVPSESLAPPAVHEAFASSFSHIYAEGYPDERTRQMTTAEILDYASELGHYRRYGDPRYYKGVEYADVLEALTRRRLAELFATASAPANKLYVNVQSLSGAPANTAVQYALMSPGDTMMSMALHVGGHLSHGSKVAYSGKTYNVVYYGVNDKTELLDYEAMRAQALEAKPKVIIGGYTSYPWAPDWQKFRQIADEVGAYLLADIAHVAGLTAAGAYPNPVGIADVVTFTTHKTFNGPRGAVIITHKSSLGQQFDRAVFPGFQGGPHMEAIAGIAAAAQLATTEKFRALQHQTVANAVALAEALEAEGVRVAYGGTDTHMVLVDCKSVTGRYGTPLMGDPAARILDIAGIVANRNTIPGDTTALYPSGVRLGTPWVTQRGLDEGDMATIAKVIAKLFAAMEPYELEKRRPRHDYRARVDFDVLELAKLEIAVLAEKAADPADVDKSTGYPHFYFINDEPKGDGDYERLSLEGRLAKPFVDWLTPSDTSAMADGESRAVTLLEANGAVMTTAWLTRVDDSVYTLDVPIENASRVMTWLRALVDGYVATDDAFGRLTFLDAVRDVGEAPPQSPLPPADEGPYTKPYYVGAWSSKEPAGEPLPSFVWSEPQDAELRVTRLYDVHREMGARMVPFGGWDMPVWYTRNLDEHRAVREAAGLFDVSHMGCWDVRGPEAAAFLDMVMVNDIHLLEVGDSQYTALFDVAGVPHDDLLVYQLAGEHYLVVVNAANNDKDWAWVNGILHGEVMIDPNRPWVRWDAPADSVVLRDLRVDEAGPDARHELAIQGPRSKDILLALGGTDADLAKVRGLPWAGVTQVTLGDFDLIISRTGYTGERTAYELWVHPDKIVALWHKLLELGEPLGLKPCGLAARDSLRIEAGLPLYGHEMAGPLDLTMAEAGFGTYPKPYKPFFVGREAYIEREAKREGQVVRFGVPEKGQPMPQPLDPVVDDKGRVVGRVTSCAIDTEGYLIGQAFVREDYRTSGTKLQVLVAPRRKPKAHEDLDIGDRVPLPVDIEVLSRFPK
ncbi:MAG: glycine cleavage system aminomethyltransferase GcvT [Anaerolineae bacterium]|nr:glycine cleavage system aminomethyltransferase GcvT [Anaerolineae bacterium]